MNRKTSFEGFVEWNEAFMNVFEIPNLQLAISKVFFLIIYKNISSKTWILHPKYWDVWYSFMICPIDTSIWNTIMAMITFVANCLE